MNTNLGHFSIAEATQCLGIGRTTLYQLFKSRESEAVKVGRRTLVRVSSVHDYMDRLPRLGDGA